ncbi:MAG: macro domain-containing protein [Planctomycetia bacterium]|nr:macro domain-containing protein [Planctomycetia bacterium]
MKIRFRNTQIELIIGNIVHQEVDAIINAANSSLAGGGGVDGAIHRGGGPSIMEETRRRYPKGCPTGQAVISGAGELNAKYVIHAVAPRWSEHKSAEVAELLASAYRNSLECAAENHCLSVSFPSLGTGAYRYPLAEAAEIALRTVRSFLESYPSQTFRLIRFVLFDASAESAFCRAAKIIFPAESILPPWMFSEIDFTSTTNYLDVQQVARYDARMGAIRDVAKENAFLLERLNLPSEARILEIGTGTGAFARAAAKKFTEVTAIDISPVMLEYAQQKNREEGVSNIRLFQAGFLTFQDAPESYDAVISSLALHHLPDVWKAAALANIHRLLKPGGIFCLVDVIYACDYFGISDIYNYFSCFTENIKDDVMRQALYGHISCENSTFHWIMEELLRRAGFHLETFEAFGSLPYLYLARKMEV